MPLFSKRRPPSTQSSPPSNTERKPAGKNLSLRAYLSDKVRPSTRRRPQEIASSNCQPTRNRQASLEHSGIADLSSTEAQFTWENIDPPSSFIDSIDQTSFVNRYYYSHVHEDQRRTEENVMINSSSQPSSVTTSLPGYNDVSGAVIVDWDGYPRFLSPQEERDRKLKLERAVKEKMLGLPRRTDFIWEHSPHAALPQYSPTKEKSSSRSPAR